jgi:hypothetical protein
MRYPLQPAFEDLSQSLRVLLEADWKATVGGLLKVDRAEAIGNIETAMGSVLNAFHSFHDSMEKHCPNHLVDWYATPSLATVLVIRNARHHNLANRIRTLYTVHAGSSNPVGARQYIFVDFAPIEEDGDTFDVYVSWSDLDALLSLPKSSSRIRSETATSIRDYLATGSFADYVSQYRLSNPRLFLNIVPLFVNAAAAIVPHIGTYLNPESMESKLFAFHFGTLTTQTVVQHLVACRWFSLPA